MTLILNKDGVKNFENGKVPDVFDQEFAKNSEVLSIMREGASYNHEVNISGKTLKIRILETREEMQIMKKVSRIFNETHEFERFPALYDYLWMLHTLQLALSTIDGSRVTTLAELEMLSEGHLSTLFDKYNDLKQLYNPKIEDVAESGEFEKWVEFLKKKEVTKNNISHGKSVALNYMLCEALEQLMVKLHTISFAEDSTTTG